MVNRITAPRKKLKQFSGPGDIFVMTLVGIILALVCACILYPVINILACSFSSPKAVTAGQVTVWPVDFSLVGYKAVFNNTLILNGYKSSFIYMIVGTLFSIMVTLIAAFPLSRPELVGKRALTFIFSFTMLFNGGLIPTYLVVHDLKMIDTLAAMVVPGALSVYNIVIARTFMSSSIPNELYEAAEIDGCSYFKMFFSITLPLSKAVIAVLMLMFAVGNWNSYFNALIYLRTQSKFPLQMVLRQILVMNEFNVAEMTADMVKDMMERQNLSNLLKYSIIVVSSAPMLMLYPFIQKYFIKGMMIGSLKG